MIQPAAPTPSPSFTLAPPAAPGGDGAAFTLVLSVIGEDASGQPAPSSDAPPTDDERQDAASDGADLPLPPVAPVFAWQPIVAPVPHPAPSPIAAVAARAGEAVPAATFSRLPAAVVASLPTPATPSIADRETPIDVTTAHLTGPGGYALPIPMPEQMPPPAFKVAMATTSAVTGAASMRPGPVHPLEIPAPAAAPLRAAPIDPPVRPTVPSALEVPTAVNDPLSLAVLSTFTPAPVRETASPLPLIAPLAISNPTIAPPSLSRSGEPILATIVPEPETPTSVHLATIGGPDHTVPLPPAVPLVPAVAAPFPVTGTTAPAFQLFRALRNAVDRDEPALTTDASTPIANAQIELRHVVAAPGDSSRPLLDMTDGRWPHAMIARIEQLRDAADATDTRIRLVPDALGAVDVSIKRDGDTLHVRFAAEQAATRTLIQDAQPRLAAVAEERGLALGGSSVDAGDTGASAQQQRQSIPAPRIAPAPRRASTDDNEPVIATGRLA